MRNFGEKLPGKEYPDRPGAYAVITNPDGRIAVVVDMDEIHLPGGGIDPGETELEALHREIEEETGFGFTEATHIGKAGQYCFSPFYQKYFRKVCDLYWIDDFTTGLNPEPDHELIWMTAEEAIERFAHECHAWAVEQVIQTMNSRPGD